MVRVSMTVCVIVAALAWCGGAGCRKEPPPPPPAGFVDVHDTIARSCADIENGYECGRAVEQYRLGKGMPSVSRAGKRLSIALGNGTVADFTDAPDPSAEDYVAFTYTEHLGCFGYHLLRRQHPDHESYFLVQETSGGRIDLPGVPVLSSDCGRLAVVSGQPLGSVLQIWRWNEGGRASVEWTYQPDAAWTAGVPVWHSITQLRLGYESDDEPGTARTLDVRLYTDGWRVER